ncbi:PITH domain-containing protein [Biomphalaria pfeifferi]|uniref:PITH domain-containing protein n=1 Tax=Biomphalaria pfeifferi TaxID=112525 RepID=A0AAD8FLX7_BIOPF|nr:PITH domain-containing protein [Biomphalaria pfeifferi]
MSHSCHGHSHGGGHNHDHDCDACCAENLRGQEFNLYLRIDMESLTCLNEVEDGSGKTIFRSFEDRLDKDKFVASDADAELLFNIPFTGSIKLKGMLVIGGERETHPNKMRLFKNRPNMSFEDVQAKADQEFDVHVDHDGAIEYKPIVARFSDVQHLSIHFPSNHGDSDRTEVYYIGLKGDYTEARRHEVTITAYETQANPADHKTSSLDTIGYMIS